MSFSGFAARHICERHGIDVFNGELNQFDAADESFDLVTFWDSIEHVATPRGDLEHAHRLLKPHGLLLVSTDNSDCLVADIARTVFHISRGRMAYPMRRVFIDRNLAYFSESSFRRLLADVGFSELKFEKMEYPIEKIRLSLTERVALGTIYSLAAITRRQAQMTVIARKR